MAPLSAWKPSSPGWSLTMWGIIPDARLTCPINWHGNPSGGTPYPFLDAHSPLHYEFYCCHHVLLIPRIQATVGLLLVLQGSGSSSVMCLHVVAYMHWAPN